MTSSTSKSRRVTLIAVLAMVLAACAGQAGTTTTESSVTTTEPTTDTSSDTTTSADVSTTAAVAEPRSMLLWDKTDDAIFDELIAMFEERNNVVVERIERTFEDYDIAVNLAVSGNEPPDVLQVSFGYKGMGPLVEAGALHPLNDYADQYGWWERQGGQAPSLSFSADGLQYGGENLYGVGLVGSLMGIYYNKAKLSALGLEVPSTFDEFVESLEVAKAAGEVPIQIGNAPQWPAGLLFATVANTMQDPADFQAWIYGQEGATYVNDTNIRTAEILQGWANSGYFTDGFNGLAHPDALAAFTAGEGLYLSDGSWDNPSLVAEMGDDLGFMLLPRNDGNIPGVTSSYDAPIAIGARSEDKDLAAEFVDFVTGPEAAQLYAEADRLVDASLGVDPPAEGTSTAAIFDAWTLINEEARGTLYPDHGATGIGPTLFGGIQELLDGRITADEFVNRVQEFYADFHASR